MLIKAMSPNVVNGYALQIPPIMLAPRPTLAIKIVNAWMLQYVTDHRLGCRLIVISMIGTLESDTLGHDTRSFSLTKPSTWFPPGDLYE